MDKTKKNFYEIKEDINYNKKNLSKSKNTINNININICKKYIINNNEKCKNNDKLKLKKKLNVFQQREKQWKYFKINIFLNLYFFMIYFPIIICENNILDLRKLNFDNSLSISMTGNLGQLSQLLDSIDFNPLPDDYTMSNKMENGQQIICFTLYWQTSITNCSGMFSNVNNLLSVDLSNFDFTQVVDMSNMFKNCINIKNITFGDKRIDKVTNMDSMFYGCQSLTTLDLSKFDTNSVTNMEHLFYECNRLTSLDLSNFRTLNVKNMGSMFCKTNSLGYLDISKFDTTKVTNMEFMFSSCGLSNIDLSNFKANSVISFDNMFYQCNNLISIDFSNKFEPISAQSMKYMFSSCNKLQSLDLSGFNTKECLANTESMFENCAKLEYLDLSKFNTQSVNNMKQMFYGCQNLFFINLDSFIVGANTQIDNILGTTPNNLKFCFNEDKASPLKSLFESKTTQNDCSDICFSVNREIIIGEKKCIINCANNHTHKYEYENECYSKCPKRTYGNPETNNKCLELICDKYYNLEETGCINEIPIGHYLLDESLKTIGKCQIDCKTCVKGEEDGNTNCLSCNGPKFFDNGNCVQRCEKDNYIDESGNKICTCNYDIKCKECSEESINKNLCISCNREYYQKYNDSLNSNGFINCYKNLDGYYLLNNFYYECYSLCKKCTELGDETNHKCIECIPNYGFIDEKNEKNNCFQKCQYFYYFNSENEYTCTEENECPLNYSKFIDKKKKCIDKCSSDDTYQFEYNNKCVKSCPLETITDNINFICKDKEVSNDKKADEVINTNQNSQYNKISDIIQNWSVENFFMGVYNSEELKAIDKDDIISNIREDIINHKIDSLLLNITEGAENDLLIKEEKILYQITTSDNQNNGTYNNISTIKLGECEDILKDKYGLDKSQPLIIFKIDYYVPGLLIPIIGYEVFDPKNKTKLNLSYCEETSINYNIPVTIDEDKSFKYDPTSEYYNDECNSYTTENGTDILLKDRKNEFEENNMSLCENVCEYIGYDKDTKQALCECGIKYKDFLLSDIDNQTNLLANNLTNNNSSNLGSLKCYDTLFTKNGLAYNIGSYIIIIIFTFFSISAFIFYKCGYQILQSHIIDIIRDKKNGKDIYKTAKISSNKIKNKTISNPRKKQQIKTVEKSFSTKKRTKKNKKYKNNLKSKESTISSFTKLQNPKIFMKKLNNNNNNVKVKNREIEIYSKNKKIIFFDYELNTLPFNYALLYDKRPYLEYYKSLIRTKHPIIFTFLVFNDYNILIIKICLFVLSFTVYYGINGLLFSKGIIHNIYMDGGYDIISVLPRILLSFFISYFINTLIKIICLSERDLLEIKRQPTQMKAKKEAQKVKKCFIIKYASFFIISHLILILLWYFLSSFGAVYQNSQIFLIINTIISFALSLIFPFIINLIPGILRIYSLNDKNKNRKGLYKISTIIQIL